MKNLETAVKIIYDLGTDFSRADWHKACSVLIDLTDINENSLNDNFNRFRINHVLHCFKDFHQ